MYVTFLINLEASSLKVLCDFLSNDGLCFAWIFYIKPFYKLVFKPLQSVLTLRSN